MNYLDNFTDDQLAERTRHIATIEAQQTEIEEVRAHLTLAEAERDEAKAELKRALDCFREDFATLAAEKTEAADRMYRAENQLRAVARHLAPIVADWLLGYAPWKDEALSEEIRERRRDASELLQLLTPFAT